MLATIRISNDDRCEIARSLLAVLTEAPFTYMF